METLILLNNFNVWGKGFGNGAEYVLPDLHHTGQHRIVISQYRLSYITTFHNIVAIDHV